MKRKNRNHKRDRSVWTDPYGHHTCVNFYENETWIQHANQTFVTHHSWLNSKISSKLCKVKFVMCERFSIFLNVSHSTNFSAHKRFIYRNVKTSIYLFVCKYYCDFVGYSCDKCTSKNSDSLANHTSFHILSTNK